MNEKLREHVEGLFSDTPNTKQIVEIKEEILQNTIDRYNDLIAEGKTEQAAFNIAVAGIGDVQSIIGSVFSGNISGYSHEEIDKNRRRSALLLAVAIMLYILCVIPVIILDGTGAEDSVGVVLMFVMVAVATGMLIYRAKTQLPVTPKDGTVVEEFKEWNHQKNEDSALFKSVISSVWAVCLVLYFVISFTTAAWHITWLIFIIFGAVTNIIRAVFDLRKRG